MSAPATHATVGNACPAQQIMWMVYEYAKLMNGSDGLTGDERMAAVVAANAHARQTRDAIERAQQEAYAEGRKDEAEAREHLPKRRELPKVDASYASSDAYSRALGWNECLDAITGELTDDEISRRYTRSIGGPNPFYRCVVCDASVPGVRNELVAHAKTCR